MVFYFKDFPFDPEIYVGVFFNKTKIAQWCKRMSKDVLCTVIYNGGILNIQQQDTVRYTVTYPWGWNILWL